MSKQYPRKSAAAGDVRISENVVRSIAKVCAKEVEGVYDLTEVRHLFCKEAPVSVDIVNDMVELSVRIVLQNGYRLPTVARQLQTRIKENVQSMTGVIVSKVHIIAVGIAFPS